MTPKQRRFCEEYLVDLNATQAAIRAGYSSDTAQQIGSENLLKPVISEQIQAMMRARSERTTITADKVLRELARIGFGDAKNLMNWSPDGVTLKPSEDLSEDDSAMVQEVSSVHTESGVNIKLKTYDKLTALEKIGKHLKLFTDVSEVNNKHTFTQMGRVVARPIGSSSDNEADKGGPNVGITLNFDVGSKPEYEQEE